MTMVKISNVIAIRDYLEVSMASARCAPCAPWLQNMGEKNQQSRSQPVSCLLFSVKCGFGGYETPRCEQMQGTAILEGDRDFEERKGEECDKGPDVEHLWEVDRGDVIVFVAWGRMVSIS